MATAFDPVDYLGQLQLWVVGLANAIAPEPGLPPERRTPDIVEAFNHLAAAKAALMRDVVLAEQAREAALREAEQAREAAMRAAAEQERLAPVRAALEKHAPLWELYAPPNRGEPREAWVRRLADHPAWAEHRAWERRPR
jgi:hypothetical protein